MTPKQLKAIRAKLGLSQAQLADKLGVHPRTMRRWELGEREISGPVEHLIRIIAINMKKDAEEAAQ